MRKQEIIAEARAIAKQMSFRSGIDGEVQPGIRRRARDLDFAGGMPFEVWRDHTQHIGKPGRAIVNNKSHACEVHDVTVHDDIGHAARSLQIRLGIVDWLTLKESSHPSQYDDWTASHAETKIVEAVTVINDLCDWLERNDPELCCGQNDASQLENDSPEIESWVRASEIKTMFQRMPKDNKFITRLRDERGLRKHPTLSGRYSRKDAYRIYQEEFGKPYVKEAGKK
jgi:hypothetical protein